MSDKVSEKQQLLMQKQVSFLLTETKDVIHIFPVRAITCDRPGSTELKS
jgi:chorismate mutase